MALVDGDAERRCSVILRVRPFDVSAGIEQKRDFPHVSFLRGGGQRFVEAFLLVKPEHRFCLW
jgi:hypothetical protein